MTYVVVAGLLPNKFVETAVDCAVFAPPKIEAAAVLVGDDTFDPKLPNELDPNRPLAAKMKNK